MGGELGSQGATSETDITNPAAPSVHGPVTAPPAEPQPVPRGVSAPQQPPPTPSRVLGEFESEDQAKLELERLRSFRDAVVADRDVQNLVTQRRQSSRDQELRALELQKEEEAILKDYVEAMERGRPNEAFVGFMRNIQNAIKKDTVAEIRAQLNELIEPVRSKRELLETKEWEDLHDISDEVVLLANELKRVGWQKPDVAKAVHTMIKKYESKKQERKTPKRSPGLLSPDSGGYLSDISEDDFDRRVDQYWKSVGFG